ncbi:MAG TPA: hypothetical protein VK797_07295 [Tepidisphaeraceae bacterium]|jgi:hypothetical protein|nr:hypothetical protein [Tepidisphaeraceae bacterium]
MSMQQRYRVQGYSAGPPPEWCICDFSHETVTGKSPICFQDSGKCTWMDRQEAEQAAALMNAQAALWTEHR